MNFYSGTPLPSLLFHTHFLVTPSILPKVSVVPSMSQPLFSILFSLSHTKYCSSLALPCFETHKWTKTEENSLQV